MALVPAWGTSEYLDGSGGRACGPARGKGRVWDM